MFAVRSNMTCALKVRDTQEKGWFKIPNKILKKIKGLNYEYTKDGMIYISGKVDPQKILKRIAKHGNKVEVLWLKTGEQYGTAPPMTMSTYPPYHHGGYCPPPPPPPMPYIPYHNYALNSVGSYHPQVPYY